MSIFPLSKALIQEMSVEDAQNFILAEILKTGNFVYSPDFWPSHAETDIFETAIISLEADRQIKVETDNTVFNWAYTYIAG